MKLQIQCCLREWAQSSEAMGLALQVHCCCYLRCLRKNTARRTNLLLARIPAQHSTYGKQRCKGLRLRRCHCRATTHADFLLSGRSGKPLHHAYQFHPQLFDSGLRFLQTRWRRGPSCNARVEIQVKRHLHWGQEFSICAHCFMQAR